jgi:hypothetical protein
MCLDIDKRYHPKYGKGKSFVADRPLLVYKRLLSNGQGVGGLSPYMKTQWYFGVTKTVPRFGFDGDTQKTAIEAGLHAFFTKNASRAGHTYNGTLFPAVIPVGARFFIGTDGEIAATAMTVYRNEAELLKAHGVTKMGDPVPREYYKTLNK